MDRRALLGLTALTLTAASTAAAPALARSESGSSSTSSFIRFPTVTATIMRPNGRRGVLTVETGVDVPDAGLRTRAEQSGPRLRAAYNTVVQQIASAMLPGAPPDVERMVTRLQAVTDSTLGRRGAHLLIGTVMVA
ncbi:Tat pathway signal protein [uncultured Brevundimonas sp.]|uniref:Tat pathway signal protein n=1 Tax=uncultured Brevundimonas sp. TaxID=213418 RepID=UPI0030EE35A5|tara:strand:- start:2488 stop:2895 length:408 start_codon:yes stop_codon:yes gene_type:complete